MQPGEVASLLFSMHKPKPKFDILQKELMELVRHPGEDLESKLALLKSLANSMYHDFTEAERIANVDRILLNGILQFTHGSTRKNAELAIEFEKRQGKHIDYQSILQGALNSERVYGAPNVKLPYNTPLNPATMIYNVRTGTSDYVHGAGSLVRTDIDIGGPAYPHFAPNNEYQEYRPDNARYNIPQMQNGPQMQNVPHLEQEQIGAAGPGPQIPVPRPRPQIAVPGAGYRDPTARIGSNINENDESLGLLRNVSQLNLDDSAFGNPAAISTPLVAETLRRTTRPQNPPERYQANLHQIQTQDLIPIITQAIENYYVNPKTSSGNNAKPSGSTYKRDPSKTRDNSKNRDNSRGRTNSRDKNSDRRDNSRNKSGRQDNSRNQSRDSSRNQSRDNYRNQSRNRNQRTNRNLSYDRNKKDDSKGRRDYSKDKKYDKNRSRSPSYTRNNNSSNDRKSRYDRSNSRDKYRSSRFTSPRRDFHESDKLSGINCSKEYNPKYEFRCLKCMTENDHHEFNCKKYHRRSKFVCKNCKTGFHFHEECEKSRSLSRDRKN